MTPEETTKPALELKDIYILPYFVMLYKLLFRPDCFAYLAFVIIRTLLHF